MSNVGALLKTEFIRLAGRVSRQADAKLKNDIVFLKHQVAELKRTAQTLKRDNAKLIGDLKGRLVAPPAAAPKDLARTRLSPRLIRISRARLGLSREDFAKLVGVSAGAVVTWEGGKSKPREEARKALIAVRKLGKRDARWRLETMSPAGAYFGHSRHPFRAITRHRIGRNPASIA
jgi:DNA-binding transcriptional regulator YiaG